MMEYRLDELFDLQMGKTPSRNNPEYWNSKDHKWISIGDLSKCGKYILDTKEYLSDKAVQESGISCIPANTVIMSFKLSIGKTAITKEPIYSNEAIMSFRDKHFVELLPDYIFYMFTGKDWEAGTNKAVMGKTLNKATLSAIKVSIHPISEQRKIVAVLDKANSIIEDRQRELTRLDELIKARFVEMFGDPELNPKKWPIETLGDVLSVEPQNGLYKPQSDYVQDGTGIPILRIDAFYDGKVTDLSGLKRLNCTETERSRYLLVENDIVINRVNSLEYLGKCAWITGLIEPTVFESNMMRFHVDESRINPCYITRLLCSPFIYKQILNRAKKAVNQASINQRDVQNLKILIPPVELQKQYAAFVAQVDKSKVAVQKSLDETQLLFNSLMQKYFG